MKFLTGFLGKYLGGPLSAVAAWLLNYFIARASSAIVEYFGKLKRRREIREAIRVYEESKTPDEQERNFDDLTRL